MGDRQQAADNCMTLYYNDWPFPLHCRHWSVGFPTLFCTQQADGVTCRATSFCTKRTSSKAPLKPSSQPQNAKTDYFLFLSISRVLVRDTHGCYLLASVDQILAVVRHVIDQKTPSGFPNSVRLTPSARMHDPALRARLRAVGTQRRT